MKPVFVIIAFFVLFTLHQDGWNWANRNLWFGFLPAGLGYQAAFSITVSVFWWLVSKYAWPSKIEEWAAQGDQQKQ